MNKHLRELPDDAIEQVIGGKGPDDLQPTTSTSPLPCDSFCRSDLSRCPHTAEERYNYNCDNCTLRDWAK